MRKIVLGLLLLSGVAHAQQAINPKEAGPFEKDRLVYQPTTSTPIDYIITDLKTGCQFMKTNSDYSPPALLGCFPELIDPKFKK